VLLDQHRAVAGRRAALALLALLAPGCDEAGCPSPSSDRTCLVARIEGHAADGELGFRFGEPLDLDGDGRADLVGGARRVDQVGEVVAVSAGVEIARWKGEYVDGLFGHVAIAVPDLDGDGRADVVVSAPNAILDGGPRGTVEAFSSSGARIWRVVGALYDGLGWHIARAPDLDRDGVDDLWVGAPSNPAQGHVYLISGRDGRVVMRVDGPSHRPGAALRGPAEPGLVDGPSHRPGAALRGPAEPGLVDGPAAADQFGWHVAAIGDLDGDGAGDVAIGAPLAVVNGAARGSVTAVSSATGATLRVWSGDLPDHLFGQMLAALDDIDGDGVADLAIGAPGEAGGAAPGRSEVMLVSGAAPRRIRLLAGREDGELYGRSLAKVDDLDGDGLADLAIGAPWYGDRAGRVEVRSTRTNAILAEVVGSAPGTWLGWHLAPAGDAAPRPGFAVSRLRDLDGRGAIEVHELR
jgi:hypothetical protein